MPRSSGSKISSRTTRNFNVGSTTRLPLSQPRRCSVPRSVVQAAFPDPYPGETDAEFKERQNNLSGSERRAATKIPPETAGEFTTRMDRLLTVRARSFCHGCTLTWSRIFPVASRHFAKDRRHRARRVPRYPRGLRNPLRPPLDLERRRLDWGIVDVRLRDQRVSVHTHTILSRVFVVRGLQHLAVENAALSDEQEPIRGLRRSFQRMAAPARGRRASHASSSRQGASPFASSSHARCASPESTIRSRPRSMSTFSSIMRREGIDPGSDVDLSSGKELVEREEAYPLQIPSFGDCGRSTVWAEP